MLHHRENNIHLDGRPTHLFQYWYNTLSLRGKYIAGVSGDDYWTDPKKLQKQVAFLEENPTYSYCYHRFRRLYENQGTADTPEMTSPDKETWAAPAAMVSRNIFDRVPPVCTEVLHEDTLSKRMLELHGERVVIEDISPSIYRMHPESIYGSKENIEKRLELYRSNVNLLPYFRDTKVGSRVREFIVPTVASITANCPTGSLHLLREIYDLARANGAVTEVTLAVLTGLRRRVLYTTYAGARRVLPPKAYAAAKSLLTS